MQEKQIHTDAENDNSTLYFYNVMADDSSLDENADRLANRKPFPGEYFPGDFVNNNRKWLILFHKQNPDELISEVGIGTGSDGLSNWSWDRALLYQNKKTQEKTFGRDLSDVQFTAAGKWFVCGRTKRHRKDPDIYNSHTRSNIFDHTECAFFLVTPLPYPLSQSAEIEDRSVSLNWQLARTQHKTMIVRHPGNSIITNPRNKHNYEVGHTIGHGTVVYIGSQTEWKDNEVEAGKEYIYCFYTLNNNFFSSGVVAIIDMPAQTIAEIAVEELPGTESSLAESHDAESATLTSEITEASTAVIIQPETSEQEIEVANSNLLAEQEPAVEEQVAIAPYSNDIENSTPIIEPQIVTSNSLENSKQRTYIEVIPDSGTFISAVGVESISQTFTLKAHFAESDLQISAPYNYKLSTDKKEWSNYAILPAKGGNLYIKYLPTVIDLRKKEIIEIRCSGTLIHELEIIGFSYESNYAPTEPTPETISTKTTKSKEPLSFWRMMSPFAVRTILLFILVLASRGIELYSGQINESIKGKLPSFILHCLINDSAFIFNTSAILLGIGIVFYYISRKLTSLLQTLVVTIAISINLLLIKYFSVALNPLGADLYHYSVSEIKQTAGSSVNWGTISFMVGFVLIVALLFGLIPRKIRINKYISAIIAILAILSVFSENILRKHPGNFGSEYNNYLSINKSSYFYKASYYHFWPQPEPDIFDEMNELFADDLLQKDRSMTTANDFVIKDEAKYPFLHTDQSHEILSHFMQKDSTAPNVVILIVEGLGRAFSNENAYLGSYTPFLDSLSRKSLYWENCLSTAGRTFEVLPSVLASLPYADHGFCEMGEKMPQHLSLLRILAANGYQTNFYYGGDSKFDNMNLFLKGQRTSSIIDLNSFGPGYQRLPSNGEGFSWGYGDFELFRKYFSVLDKSSSNKPQISVILTVSTHSPFRVNNQARYDDLFDKRLAASQPDKAVAKSRKEFKPHFASVLFMDEAVRKFFNDYKSRPSFKNTIFLITGDHRMPDIPMSTKIDRYHVPLIIYSPLLNRTAKFPAVVSHLDIAPSLLAYIKRTKGFKSPSLVSWLGAGLDTSRVFRNINNYPLIQSKQGVNNYLSGEFFWDGQDLQLLDANMGLSPIQDDKQKNKTIQLLNKFKLKNSRMMNSASGLVPDSLLQKY
ncbi:MAG: hypothetical protein RIS29_1407 [Bacteroidota bacterium]